MRTRINNVRVALPALLAVGAIAAGIAGCGGGAGGHSSARTGARPPAASSAQRYTPTSHPAAAASPGIPQHNGGDQDTDNNGGPSDGDGNL